MEHQVLYPSPLGPLHIISSDEALTEIRFEASHTHLPDYSREYSVPLLQEVQSWLDKYFAGASPDPRSLPLNPTGKPFQKLVWELLLTIPYGKTFSYGALAKEAAGHLGIDRMSAQAIGNAVGRNPIPIVIPCHRVLGSDGRLTGYAGGLDRKRYLLALENIPFR